jgi:hypothetical protein
MKKMSATLVLQLTLLDLDGIVFAMWSFRCIPDATSIALLRCHTTTFVWLWSPLPVLAFYLEWVKNIVSREVALVELTSCSREISLDLLIWFASGSHYNTLTLTKSLIFQDFTFLQNRNPLWQMPMLKPVLWNLLKDLNDLCCTHPNDAAIVSI